MIIIRGFIIEAGSIIHSPGVRGGVMPMTSDDGGPKRAVGYWPKPAPSTPREGAFVVAGLFADRSIPPGIGGAG